MHEPSASDILKMIRLTCNATKTELDRVVEELSQLQGREKLLKIKYEELLKQEYFWSAEAGEPCVASYDPEREANGSGAMSKGALPPRIKDDGEFVATADLPNVGRGVTLGDLARWVLLQSKHPMNASEIAERIAELGHPLPEDSQARHNSVYSAMWRRKHVFKQLGGGPWDLVDR